MSISIVAVPEREALSQKLQELQFYKESRNILSRLQGRGKAEHVSRPPNRTPHAGTASEGRRVQE